VDNRHSTDVVVEDSAGQSMVIVLMPLINRPIHVVEAPVAAVAREVEGLWAVRMSMPSTKLPMTGIMLARY